MIKKRSPSLNNSIASSRRAYDSVHSEEKERERKVHERSTELEKTRGRRPFTGRARRQRFERSSSLPVDKGRGGLAIQGGVLVKERASDAVRGRAATIATKETGPGAAVPPSLFIRDKEAAKAFIVHAVAARPNDTGLSASKTMCRWSLNPDKALEAEMVIDPTALTRRWCAVLK